MRTLTSGALAATAAAAILLASASPAAACRCVTETVEDHAAAADAIIVANIRGPIVNTPTRIGVTDVLKGEVGDSVDLTNDPTDCGVGMTANQDYLLFLIKSGDLYTTDMCRGSAPLEAYNDYELSWIEARYSPEGDQAGDTTETEPAPGNSQAQQEELEAEHRDVPWIPILILALAIPTAALVIPAFFMRGHDASRDSDD